MLPEEIFANKTKINKFALALEKRGKKTGVNLLVLQFFKRRRKILFLVGEILGKHNI